MDLKYLIEMVNELSSKRFYGTLQIEFRNGKPYLGTRSEKVLFDQPMLQSLNVSPSRLNEVRPKNAG